ncbi:MAG: AMP-binding protein [Comamonas sp.]|nr:AMP-binding protein [Comamonas sp.]
MPAPSAQTDRFVHERMPPAQQLPQFRYDLPELQIPDQANVVSYLFAAAHANGWSNNLMLRSPGQTYTYAEAEAQVNRMAEMLIKDFKLEPGNRVLLRGGNSIGMAMAWLAGVKAGLIVVPTMPLLRAPELDKIIDKAQPALAICEADLLKDMVLAAQDAKHSLPVLCFGDDSRPDGMEQRAARRNPEYAGCATSADDPALLAFTSGTTGVPKAVITTHRDILAACNGWPRHILKATPEDIVTGSPPLAFTFGTGGLLIYPMFAGASVYYPDVRFGPETMVRKMRDNGITICYTAPTFYRQMAPYAKALGIPSLRVCVSAGEALPDATRQLWKEATGIEMLDGIGGTEMWHIYISAAGDEVRPGSIGKAVPGYQAKVVDDEGNEVPRGTVGRLAVIGPTGCRYLEDERQTQYVHNGWNHPGDAFTQDEDGYFFYQARDDDMIVTAGYNVGGPEVEDCLLTHPAVAECGVVGKPDEVRGMIIKAFVVLKAGHPNNEAMAETLQDYVKKTIAPYKYPREIEFVTALPRTETGKLQRFKLRQSA